MGDWFSRNTDKFLLFTLCILGGFFMLHIIHHGNPDMGLITWLENAFSTVLGALVMILTGTFIKNKNGGTNAPPPTELPIDPGSHL